MYIYTCTHTDVILFAYVYNLRLYLDTKDINPLLPDFFFR